MIVVEQEIRRSSPCRRRQLWPIVPSLLAVVTAIACSTNRHPLVAEGSDEEPRALAGQSGEPARPPPGRWRLVPFERLLRVSLPLSHILIRHAEVDGAQVPLSAFEWRAPQPAVVRTRAEAAQIAESLAAEARVTPDRFPELARRYSEDPVTAAAGGALGVIAASQLAPWPTILDALAATAAGGATDPVETEFGFHVFWRQRGPEESVRSGARIVISHEDAPFIRGSARHPGALRSRAEAMELAGAVYQAALDEPDRFSELVDLYSDHRDAAREGDFGSWSSREPTALSREIASLQPLAIGQVAAPIDTLFGFQIIQRTADRARVAYAMTAVNLPFDSTLPATAPDSKESVEDAARTLARHLARHPKEFAIAQRQYCCDGRLRVDEGRSFVALEAVLARTAVGAVASEPVETGDLFKIVKRLPLSDPEPDAPISFELPSPASVDIGFVFASLSRETLANLLRTTGTRAEATCDGSIASGSPSLAHLHAEWNEFDDDNLDTRIERFVALEERVRARLTPNEFERYLALVNDQFERALLAE